MRQGAETLGFNARAVRASTEIIDRIKEAPLPAIIHWKGYHWVVLYGQQGKKYVIADPAIGIRYLTKHELSEGWANLATLLLQPDATRFYVQGDDQIGGFGRFFQRVWHYRGIIFQALLYAQVIGLLSLAFPFLIHILTDDVLVRGDTRLLSAVAIAVIIMNADIICTNVNFHYPGRLNYSIIFRF